MLLIKESVLSLKEKTTQHWFSYFLIANKDLTYFRTDPLNIILDDFGTCSRLIGQFSCPYIPHWHYFIRTLWL